MLRVGSNRGLKEKALKELEDAGVIERIEQKHVNAGTEDDIDRNVNAAVAERVEEILERSYPNVPEHMGTLPEGYTATMRNIPTALSFIYNVEAAGKPKLIRKVASKRVKRRAGAKRENITARYGQTVNEAKIYTKLQSVKGWRSYILPFQGSEQEGNSVALTFEYVEGLDLHDYLEEVKPSPAERAELLAQAAKALAFCHENGIAHWDIKPENFYVAFKEGVAPHVFIFDFGTSQDKNTDKVGWDTGIKEDISKFKRMVEKIIGKLTFTEGGDILKFHDIPEDEKFLSTAIVVLKAVSEGVEDAAAVAGAGKGGGRRRSRKGRSNGRGKTRSRLVP